MEQPFSSSKVTVEYFDPHDVYKLLSPGLIPRLPLRDLNWQSHAGPVRSINTLHVELVPADQAGTVDRSSVLSPTPDSKAPGRGRGESTASSRDDGFSTAPIGGGRGTPTDNAGPPGAIRHSGPGITKERRHQIPGLRRTPYLKILFVRCDDNDAYKSTTRSEIREWIKANTHSLTPGKTASNAENHDAFEWLIVHVVIPNTVAATQPRSSGSKAADSSSEKTSALKWRTGSSTLLEKLRNDFNGTGKGAVDRVRQIRIGINDVPYDLFPRVVPAVPTGYQETEQDSENAWQDLIGKIKELILSSFDIRVTQYEEDIKDKDAQRGLPGWNFCTFFILKEGLARGFESVGLVEDALVGYDELSIGLDAIIKEQAISGSAEAHGGALLDYTEELKILAEQAASQIFSGSMEFEDEETVDLQTSKRVKDTDPFGAIPISSTKKPYRELILANNISLFDFRCYIFSRQVALLLRLGNAWSTREELLAKLKEQQDMAPRGVAPRAPPPKQASDESENLSQLAEICRRTLEFVPAVSMLIRKDILAALGLVKGGVGAGDDFQKIDPVLAEVIDNIVASFAFSVAQQILAQTSTKSLQIPAPMLATSGDSEHKSAIPEPKTMIHPARSSSIPLRQSIQRPPPSPVGFPGPGRKDSVGEYGMAQFLKTGLEELAATRAELYTLSRNVLEECGKRRGWTNGWAAVPIVGESADLQEISLDDEPSSEAKPSTEVGSDLQASVAGVGNELLRTALDNKDDFYRLYETLTDKAMRHYSVAKYDHSVQATKADLAVLKFHLSEYKEAEYYFYNTIPFFGGCSWSLLELSMLVMYAGCLKELGRQEDYVTKALRQLLTKAAAAERDRLQQKSKLRIGNGSVAQYPENSAISGFLADMLTVSATLEKEVKIPLTNFFGEVELDGPPTYDDDQDSFSLSLKLRSLLVDEFDAESVSLRISSPGFGGNKEIWVQAKGPVTIKPGRNKVPLQSNMLMPGNYEVDQIRIKSSNILLHFERELGQVVEKPFPVLQNPVVTLYQRTSSLDVRLSSSKDIRLDTNNMLEVEVMTGWNDITSAEVKIKSATGGLRLLMGDAVILDESAAKSKKAEGGTFTFGAITRDSSVKISFPFRMEQDVLHVAVKVEVTYSTDKGTFTFFKTSSVSIALALGVNVQDVFKHKALFSRFTVSTASPSPLRLYKSELIPSELFESHYGIPPSDPVAIFPKQPASLLYKVTKKPGVTIGPNTKKTLYLKLWYSVLQDEIEDLLDKTLTKDLADTPLRQYSKLIVYKVLAWSQKRLTAYELEKCTLLGELSTSFLSDVNWATQFPGIGPTSSSSLKGEDSHQIAAQLAAFLRSWLLANPVLPLSVPNHDSSLISTILIPVDIPPITIVHTTDIVFQQPPLPINSTSVSASASLDNIQGHPTFIINQQLPATLRLKWTRIWDTVFPASPQRSEDLEFSYEINAPPDTWLVGGRRKGHFVIPAATTTAATDQEDGEKKSSSTSRESSTPQTEADIPLLLIPLREGYLPYPSVDIKQVKATTPSTTTSASHSSSTSSSTTSPTRNNKGQTGAGAVQQQPQQPQAQPQQAQQPQGHYETDNRNLGEVVQVISDRARVTLSLDASGPAGGPLVLECERVGLEGEGGRVVA
ncbi:trafficking protein particle complex subunit 10 [Neurospora intermedia]|uniref:Trafficking protein particle complex subunit 10 n=1 Tax=Neurospora intermedia TaxID=5142 RepID=A0ABR3D5I1_NEUIN